ncbi:MAG: hypothetical protein ACLVJO_11290 [[Clostridium] scindens]
MRWKVGAWAEYCINYRKPFAKNWGCYWRAVVGMHREMTADPVGIGIFAKMMSRGGVAQGFVWLEIYGLHGGMFVVFAFIATSIISMSTGTSIERYSQADSLSIRNLAGRASLYLGAILSGAIFGDNVVQYLIRRSHLGLRVTKW